MLNVPSIRNYVLDNSMKVEDNIKFQEVLVEEDDVPVKVDDVEDT